MIETAKLAFYQQFKKPFFGRFMRPWRWPEDVDQEQWHRLSIDSESGSTLSALLAHSTSDQVKGAILMVHPMGVAAKGFWLKYGHADLLRQAGYHVMVFDLNGFGDSTNTTMDYPLDVLSAGRHLKEMFPDLPIGLLGTSMGAAMSVCAMSLPGHPFKAAVLESAFPTLLHFWSRYPIPKLGIQVSKLLYPKGERQLRPLFAASNLVSTPSLFMIYGDQDIFTPVDDGQLLWRALKQKTKTEFWQVEGADHTHAYRAQPSEYSSRVVAFFNRDLAEAKVSLLSQGNNF